MKREIQELKKGQESMIEEIKKVSSPVPASAAPVAMAPSGVVFSGGFPEAWTALLTSKDAEIDQLKSKLKAVRSMIEQKDELVVQLNGDLATTIQDSRHVQVDLEFHQAKVAEYVRKNQELEEQNKAMLAELEYATQEVKHTSIDLEAPRLLRSRGFSPGGHLAGSPGWACRRQLGP